MILKGIMFMHRKGVLHNDLKTNNVVLKSTKEGTIAVIVDMGKATLRKHPEVYKLSERQKKQKTIQ